MRIEMRIEMRTRTRMRMRMRNNKYKTRHKDIKILRYLTAPAIRCGGKGVSYVRFLFSVRLGIYKKVLLGLGLNRVQLSDSLRKRPNDSEVHKSSAVDLTN